MTNSNILPLLIYSVFTVNIVLQCGLGIKGIVESKSYINKSTFIKLGLIFLSIILLWLFFCKIVFSINSGIFIYVLIIPVSALTYDGFEYLIFNYLFKDEKETETFISFPNGITAAAVFVCVNIANNIVEVLILSFGFTSGIFFVYLIIREIRKRAALEAVPVFLRGKPLVLVAMGMLSLVFTAASLLFFRMIKAG
jgi:electron transport complex protein RnfA